MKDVPCCNDRLRLRRAAPEARRSWASRLGAPILSGVLLVLIPKCPVCLAAQVAFLTGISVSIGLASHLRMALIVVSFGVLGFFTLTWLGRIYGWRKD